MISPSQKPQASAAREIFLEASGIEDPADRIAFVEKACSGDARLQSEVDALFLEAEQLGGFLERPALSAAAASTGARPTERAHADPAPSEHIGPYKLLQVVGEGGCGVVYMAEQEHPVRRRVALKVIKLGMDTKSVIARFESERQALAMMDHPNIAKVFDAGATDRGRPYFVMELVRGIPITDYCDQHRLSTNKRLKLFIQVSQAIQHAHQKGIIHRDIKPSNILVTLHDGVPVPKIIDFGIAKATDQRLTDKTLFTEFQSFIGTPAYMSPEQAEMSSLDIDTRSDIYALGVLLYELLVGQTPFDAQKLRDGGLDECRRTIREVEPARPSARLHTMVDADRTMTAERRHTDTGRLIQSLRGDLDWIVMKCLEKDRQRRYPTANALAEDLQNYLDGDLVSARPPSALYRLQKGVRRHRLAFTAVGSIATTLVAAVIISTWQAVRATRAEQQATTSKTMEISLRREAERKQIEAVKSAERARLNEYVADMNVVHTALDEGNFGRAAQLLDKHRPRPGQADLRGFEWRYLAGLSRGDGRLSYPHQGDAVNVLEFSPTGNLLAVGMKEEIKIWDTRTQSLTMTLDKGAHSIAFLPNETTMITANGSSLSIWHTTTWTEQITLRLRVESLALSHGGHVLATSTAERDGGIQIWDTSTWQQVRSCQDASGPLAFSPDDATLASDSREGIALWTVASGERLRTLDDSAWLFHPFMRHSSVLTFSSDGRRLLAPRNQSSARGVFVMSVWDVDTGRELDVLPADPQSIHHTGMIAALELSSDGETLITASHDHSLGLWSLGERSLTTTLRGHRNEVWAVAFSPDGRTVASGGKDGELHLWPASTPKAPEFIEGLWQPLAFSQDGRHLAAVNRENRLTIFEAATCNPVSDLELERENGWNPRPSAMAVSNDLKTLVAENGHDSIDVWNLTTKKSFKLSVPASRMTRLSLSPDGRYLLVTGRQNSMTWWDLEEAEEPLMTLAGDGGAFSPDGESLVIFTERGESEIQIWDVASRDRRRTLTIPTRLRFNFALSPDGGLIAVPTDADDSDHAIRLWDTHSGDLVGSCFGHKQPIWSVAFSPDGKTLASAGSDSTLKLWNVATQQELLSIRRIGARLSHLTFSPDGQWLAAGPGPFSSSGDLRLFQASPEPRS